MILDYLSNLKKYQAILPRFEQYEAMLAKVESLENGKYEFNDVDFMNIVDGQTEPIEEGKFEFHRNYLDIQIMLEGQEIMKWQNLHELTDDIAYDEKKDMGFMSGEGTTVTVKPGMFYIVFPEDAHMPGKHHDISNTYRKAVVKIKCNE